MSLWIRMARSWQAVCLAATFSMGAAQYAAAQLTLDDFSTGPDQQTLKTGENRNTQMGNMWGGSRETIYVSCPNKHCSGGGVGDNPFHQPNSFEIRNGNGIIPSALIFNSGYKTYPDLSLRYGYAKPMNEDLASKYDRIRVNFDGASQSVNFDIQVFSNNGSLYSELGCNLASPGGFMTAFSADFPFKNFKAGTGTPGADFKGVTNMIFEFGESEGPNMEADYAVTSIQAVPTGDQPAAFVCIDRGR
jgi:hypothetical protein